MQVCQTSVPVLALALLLSVVTVAASLPDPDRLYKILMLTPVSSRSHRNVFMPLATELTKRGHKVTLVSNHPPHDNNPNITYIEHGLPHFREEAMDVFGIREDISKMVNLFAEKVYLMAKDLYKVPVIKDLYSKRDQFDLVVLDNACSEVSYPFTHKKPFIAVGPAGLEPVYSAIMGNILNPAYASSILYLFETPLTFMERLQNIFFTLVLPICYRSWNVIPLCQREISKQFPELPSILEMERNVSLVLLNSHFSLSTPLPVLPSQIEVGCMHCGPGKPLPRDISNFISGNEPVVYFSLGSFAQGTTIPLHYQQLLISAFSKLPYKVLWKFEKERKDLPDNVMSKNWMPQQDILSHPNVKLFISHCGMLSTQEAMYHSTPVLGLPIFGDQPRNAKQLEINGIGKMLVWEELSEQLITDSIKELVTNSSYRNKATLISATFKDQPQSPVERAVFWTEYVIRHSGAVHLRSPERDLSWVEVLHLDILLALHLVLFLVVWSIKKMLKFCFGSAKNKKVETKREKVCQ